jgi:hypothetical protein
MCIMHASSHLLAGCADMLQIAPVARDVPARMLPLQLRFQGADTCALK